MSDNQNNAGNNQMTRTQLEAEIARLQGEIKNSSSFGLAIKTSTKGTGTVCVFGLQRNPVSLYPSQWKRLLAVAKDIDAHIEKGLADGSLTLEKRIKAVEGPVPTV